MEIEKIIKVLESFDMAGSEYSLKDTYKAVKLAISALERQRETTHAPCSFCEQLEENNMECCIAGEDFIEPIYCPVCGRELER